jgi:hypothetical protein
MILFFAYLIAFLSTFVIMFPLKDQRERQRGFPWVTLAIVLTNVLVYIGTTLVAMELATATALDYNQVYFNLLYPYMTIAGLTANGQGVGALSVITSGFLHAGLEHLLGNMFFLWFFGRKLEDVMGPVRYLLFYLLCLFTADFLSTVANVSFSSYHANLPGLGASGAISGLLAGYFLLYGEERISTFIFPIPWAFRLPAWVFIIKQFLGDALTAQFIKEFAEMGIEVSTGVGVFAHLGGALGGFLFVYLFLHPEVLAQQR